jgi:DNA-binding HxlR family transcriptional regulator
MERKAMMKMIGIFTGKQRDYNIQVLTLLYDNEPMSDWKLTAKVRSDKERRSLHPTINKRLRELEKKGYVRRKDKKWYLLLKGILAVLLIQKKPKAWNPKWKEIFEKEIEAGEKESVPLLRKFGISEENIHPIMKGLGLTFDNFDSWVEFSKKVKALMEIGMINFDVAKVSTMFLQVLLETNTSEQLSNILKPDGRINSA